MGPILLLFAGLFGALGVGASAYAMHGAADPGVVAGGAAIALVHGPALISLAGLGDRTPRMAGLVGALWIAGVGLFCGDLAARTFLGGRLFANAAPIGGSILIAAWLVLALGGPIALWRSKERGDRR